jgi:hypothetical protein
MGGLFRRNLNLKKVLQTATVCVPSSGYSGGNADEQFFKEWEKGLTALKSFIRSYG